MENKIKLLITEERAAFSAEELAKSIDELIITEKSALIVHTNNKSRVDLGRPNIPPVRNKENFQIKLRNKNDSIDT